MSPKEPTITGLEDLCTYNTKHIWATNTKRVTSDDTLTDKNSEKELFDNINTVLAKYDSSITKDVTDVLKEKYPEYYI